VVPFVRVVVLNYDGGDVTLRCLDSLTKLMWPRDRLEIVMVDNASVDGLVWKIPRLYPGVRIIESLENEGFARGNNLALADLDGVDVVCLLNNDAWVEPDWLEGLVEVLEKDPKVGATCSKMLFAKEVIGVEIDPGEHPTCLTNVRVDGRDVLHLCGFDERFDKTGMGAGSPTPQHWITKPASVWFPLPSETETPTTFSIELFSDTEHTVAVRGIEGTQSVEVGPTSRYFDHAVTRRARVINNAGGGLFPGWTGGDIGFRELDLGDRDVPAEPFSFCGGAVAFRSAFLREVGLFDPTFFLYYEDLDLAWRGRFHGWTYRYVPGSVVYHEHAYSSVEGSHFFNFWVDRNRRLTLIKNAPARVAAKAFFGAVVWGLRDTSTPIVRALVRGRRLDLSPSRHRFRQMLSLVKATPSALAARRRLGRLNNVRRSFALDWMTER
jgi:GT2 family glycosyltransferase